MTSFLQYVLGGLAAGSLYGLAALALTTVFKTTGLVNFAQADMAMVCTFVCFTLLTTVGLPYWLAFVGALGFAVLFGMVLERAIIRPNLHKPHISQIMVTLGLANILNGGAGLIWDYQPQALRPALAGAPLRFAGLAVDENRVVIFVVAAVIMAVLYVLFRYTLAGVALRAVAQNLTAARLMGIPIGRVFSMSWALAAVLGAVGGILIAPMLTLDPNFMASVGIKAFAAGILGGFASMPGVVVGGLLLGVLESLVAAYVSTNMKNSFAFALILLVLVIRPYGLFGAPAAKKV